MQRLARFAEPWRVERTVDGVAVCDANGVVLVQLPRHGDGAICDAPLSDTEAAELARLIALLPMLSRRPQY